MMMMMMMMMMVVVVVVIKLTTRATYLKENMWNLQEAGGTL